MNILRNCRLIDGLGGYREGIDIAFTAGRILTIGENLSGNVSYDVRGATVLPGFIDTHVHLIANAEADPSARMKESDECLVLTAYKNAMTSLRSGLTEMEAILARTHHGAEALGIEADVGSIEPGKCADFVVIDGNPLEEISTLKHRILLVFQNGEIAANHGFAYG